MAKYCEMWNWKVNIFAIPLLDSTEKILHLKENQINNLLIIQFNIDRMEGQQDFATFTCLSSNSWMISQFNSNIKKKY